MLMRHAIALTLALLVLLAGPISCGQRPTAGGGVAASRVPTAGVQEPLAPPPTAAPPTAEQMLERSWASYRRAFIQSDGRTIDPYRDGATTSEGQSYSLLRAVWMNDRMTFDTVLAWSDNNLRVRGDQLYGYLWGKQPNGGWGILDKAVATDADQDIALALIMAERRWGDRRHLDQARAILRDMWAATVVEVRGRPYLTAGDWAPAQATPTLNPSYLAPYAYRVFAQVDPERPWTALVDTSYEVITRCSEQPLDRVTSANLPPNWCAIDPASGAFLPPPQGQQPLDTDFGYDAFRTYWRVALDARWNGEPRAMSYLQRSDALRLIWQRHGVVSAIYRHDGAIVREGEDPTLYAGLLANLMIVEPAAADALFAAKIAPLFTERDGQAYWSPPENYYLQNWLWFGVLLYADRAAPPEG